MEEGEGGRCGGVVSPTVSKEIPARSVRGGQAAVTSRHARLGLKFRRFRKFVAFILKTRGRRPVRSIGSTSGASQLPFGAHTVPVAPLSCLGGDLESEPGRCGSLLHPEAFFSASLLPFRPVNPEDKVAPLTSRAAATHASGRSYGFENPVLFHSPGVCPGRGGGRHAELRRDFDAVLRLSCSFAAVRRSEPRQK